MSNAISGELDKRRRFSDDYEESLKEELEDGYKLLKDLKKGEYFTKKKIDEPKESQVWVKDDYDRESRKFFALNFSDMNKSIQLKGDTKVYVDFTFWN